MADFKRDNRFGGGGNRGGFHRGGSDRGAPRGGGSFGGGGRRDFSRPTEMHQATCANCNKTCEVPFRPNGKRPVYCKDCFATRKPEVSAPSFSRSNSDSRPSFRSEGSGERNDGLRSQVEALSTKMDKLMKMIEELKAAPARKEQVHLAVEAALKTPKKAAKKVAKK